MYNLSIVNFISVMIYIDCSVGEISCEFFTGGATCVNTTRLCDGNIDCIGNAFDENPQLCGKSNEYEYRQIHAHTLTYGDIY